MNQQRFPDLSLSTWRGTRDSLHRYSRLLGAIRHGSSPRQRQWAHITLRVVPEGLITTPMPFDRGTFGLRLDLIHHQLRILTSAGENLDLPLKGQSLADFYSEVRAAFEGLEIPWGVDSAQFLDESAGEWDREAVSRYRRALAEIDTVFKTFKGEHREETSPVQLFPHHFDLALSWFSGRKVTGQDPENEDWANEQMTLGYATGDDSIPEPYFYATAYPEPEGFVGSTLPERADWNEAGFSGAVLPYAVLVGNEQSVELLAEFLEKTHEAGASRMVG